MGLYVREYDWMWKRLNLSLAECRVYAYILALTKGNTGGYNGSKRHLAELLGLDEKSVRNVLNTLEGKHLIVSTEEVWRSAELVRSDDAELVRESADSVRENADLFRSPRTPLYNYNNNINKTSSSLDTRYAQEKEKENFNLINLISPSEMETIADVLKRKDSFQHFWALNPKFREIHSGLWQSCMKYWNRMDYDRQRRLFYFVRKKIRGGQTVDDNPMEVLTHTHPYPVNYNGSPQVEDVAKTHKLVKAWYRGHEGIYLPIEAMLWKMTNVKPFNL